MIRGLKAESGSNRFSAPKHCRLNATSRSQNWDVANAESVFIEKTSHNAPTPYAARKMLIQLPMLICDFTPELPVTDAPPDTKVDMTDVVVSLENKDNGMLGVRLRKGGKYGQEYTVTLRIPEDAFQKTLLTIIRKEGMTLREIGEIDIEL